MFLKPSKSLASFDLREGMRVADFGAGSGTYSREASLRVGHTGRVYAIEVQKDLLKKLEADIKEHRILNIECIWGDIEKKGGTKLSDGSMDRVILANVLFQVSDKLGLIDEAHRVLKKDGLVLLVDWKDSYGGMGPATDHVVSSAKAIELFTKRGFSVLETISVSEHHYGIIFKYE